ncbi:hypothetical protein HK099_003801 [Clydaea vesicula]|uniref:Uncharacterized protein n=1 Tax=Clydaea vesicula TaxID=447962 RepID=A0AAD5U4F7_9FUNG|nr:hypothetical protein HK099_003801 [Clydaea vesicula]
MNEKELKEKEMVKKRETPRPYQIQLFEMAIGSNVIAYLDTGAGKTLVSILLMDHFSQPLIQIDMNEHFNSIRDKTNLNLIEINPDVLRQSLSQPQPKKIVFLVPTILLVSQQASKVKMNTNLEVGEYTSEEVSSVSSWDAVGWLNEFSKRNVFIMTPQIFLNLLRHGFIVLKRDISLLIFDECHHAFGNHPYNHIMQEFYHTLPTNQRPKVFGMTASPIYQNIVTHTDSKAKLTELQANLDSKIITVENRNSMKNFIAKPKEIIVEYEPSTCSVENLEAATSNNVSLSAKYFKYHRSLLLKRKAELEIITKNAPESKDETANKELMKIKKCILINEQIVVELGAFCGGLAAELYSKDFKLKSNIISNLVEDQTITENQAIVSCPSIHEILPDDLSPKLNLLFKLLRERDLRCESVSDFSGIVFVDRRITADIISKAINYFSAHLFSKVLSTSAVGGGNGKKREVHNFKNEKKKGLDDFREGKANLVVATRVAEEGVDVYDPACRLVVIFDLLRSSSGYVQSRGRARHLLGSEYIIMIRRDDSAALQSLSKARMAELMTRNISTSGELESISDSLKIRARDSEIISGLVGELKDSSDLVTKIGATAAPNSAGEFLARYFGAWNNFLTKKFQKLPSLCKITNCNWSPTKGNENFSFLVFQLKDSDEEAKESFVECTKMQKVIVDEEANHTEDNTSMADYGYVYCLLVPVTSSLQSFISTVKESVPKIVKEKLNCLSQTDVSFLPIFGSVRFTKKSAFQSASFEAIKLLYKLGALNEHLLIAFQPNSAADSEEKLYQKKGSTFSAKKIILANQDKLLFYLLKTSTNSDIADVPGEAKYKHQLSSVLTINTEWDQKYLYSVASPLSTKHLIPLYVTILSFGPEYEVYGRDCNPPVCPTYHLFNSPLFPTQLPEDWNNFYYFPTYSSFVSSTKEPRKSFAILSKKAIPSKDIPPFLIQLSEKVACKVKCLNWIETYDEEQGERDCYRPVEFSEDEFAKILNFQEKFWDFCLAPNKNLPKLDQNLKKKNIQQSPYFLLPMSGSPILFQKKNETVETFNADLLFSHLKAKETKTYTFEELLDPPFCHWYIDWETVNHTTSASRISLSKWVNEITAITVNLCDDYEAQKGRKRKIDVVLQDAVEDASLLHNRNQFNFEIEAQTEDDYQDLMSIDESSKIENSKTDFFSFYNRESSFTTLYNKILSTKEKNVYKLLKKKNINKNIIVKVDEILFQTLCIGKHNKIPYLLSKVLYDRHPTDTFSLKSENDKLISFVDYYKNKELEVKDLEASLIQARLCGYISNWNPKQPSPLNVKEVELVPEFFDVIPFSSELFHLSQAFPSILHEVEMYTLVDDFRLSMQLPLVTNSTLFTAFSATSAGNSSNYERLENLGDSFLKFAVTLDVYRKNPQASEGEMNVKRVAVISNSNLYNIAIKCGFEKILFVYPFNAKHFTPPGRKNLLIEEDSLLKIIGKKPLADCVEALIGAYYVDGGQDIALKFMHKIELVSDTVDEKVCTKEYAIDTHKDDSIKVKITDRVSEITMTTLTESVLPIKYNVSGSVYKFPFSLKTLEIILNYQFKNKNLAIEAFLHPSFQTGVSYQQLEFLGDAVLDWVLTRFLYNSNANSSPGDLSVLRQAIVCNESLAWLSISLGLNKLLLSKSQSLEQCISSFVTYHFQNENSATNDLEQEGEETMKDFELEAPKVLGDIFESCAGAVFVDCGYSLEIFWNVFKPLMINFITKFTDPKVLCKSPIRIFCEFVQKFGFSITRDLIFNFQISENKVFCEVRMFQSTINVLLGTGNGNTKHSAKKQACFNCLEDIKKNSSPLVTDIDKLVLELKKNIVH